MCAPTFSEYAEAASYYGACVQEFPLSEADDFDVPASFARAIEGPGDVAYLCNPNNPTGRLVDPRVIDAAACRCEQVGALLVVDECFLGFAPDARERSVAARAACSHHVAVLSAFTKLYGMAGLRLGYLISGNAQLIEGIRRAGQAWPSPRSPRPRASPPWKTSNTSRARAMYWRASERGFPTSSPRSGFPSCRRMRTSF